MSTLQQLKENALRKCHHCATEFRSYKSEDRFCCSGCEYVYGLIHDEDLDKFYDLQGSSSAPIGFKVFAERNYTWLEAQVLEQESKKGQQPSLTLSLAGISCIGCVWLIEQVFSKQSGGGFCRIDVQRGEIEIAWVKGKFNPVSFAQKLHTFGYDLSTKREEIPSENKKLVWRMALCGAFTLNAMLYTLPAYLGMEENFLFSGHFDWLSGIFATLSMLVGGSYFIKHAAVAAVHKVVHMDLPIAIGLLVAYSASCYAFLTDAGKSLLYFDFISTFVFLMLCGKWLHIFAIERNRNRLATIEVQPPIVSIINEDGSIREANTDQIQPEDRYLLDPGLWIPVESTLVSDRACLGMDWINGESESRLFAKDAQVPSGAINQGLSKIELIAKEHWQESLLNKLLKSHSEEFKGDRLTQKWITIYLLTVMVIAVLGATTWILLGTTEQALAVFVSALVVSCPCALGVALPLANELASSRLKLRGVFVRTHNLWNRLTKVSQIVFDKTGTLTRSTLDWTNPTVLHDLNDDELDALCALTLGSRHPVAVTVHEQLLAKGYFKGTDDWSINEDLGCGMRGSKNGAEWRFGKSIWAGSGNSNSTILSRNGQEIAAFEFEDRPWADALYEVDALQKDGFEVSILSGDTQEKVQKAAQRLGIDPNRAVAGMSPEMKQDWLRNHGGEVTLVLGDGANDSLAFDAALCSGTPAAEKTTLANKSDFYYLGAGIQGVRSLLKITNKRRTAIRSLLVFATTYNAATISLALAGIVTPLLAAILMPLSSIVSLLIVWGVLRRN